MEGAGFPCVIPHPLIKAQLGPSALVIVSPILAFDISSLYGSFGPISTKNASKSVLEAF